MSEPTYADLAAHIAATQAELKHLRGDLREAKEETRRALDDIKGEFRRAIDEINKSRQGHTAQIYARLGELEKAQHIETGRRALKATLWTAIAGATGAAIHALLKWLDGGGPPSPPRQP